MDVALLLLVGVSLFLGGLSVGMVLFREGNINKLKKLEQEEIPRLVEEGKYEEAKEKIDEYRVEARNFLPDLRNHFYTKAGIMEKTLYEVEEGKVDPQEFYEEVERKTEEVRGYNEDLRTVEKDLTNAVKLIEDLSQKYGLDDVDINYIRAVVDKLKEKIEERRNKYTA